MGFGEVGADYYSYNSHKSKIEVFELIWEYQMCKNGCFKVSQVSNRKQVPDTKHWMGNQLKSEKCMIQWELWRKKWNIPRIATTERKNEKDPTHIMCFTWHTTALSSILTWIANLTVHKAFRICLLPYFVNILRPWLLKS